MNNKGSFWSLSGQARRGVRSNGGHLIEMWESRVMLSSYYLNTLAQFTPAPFDVINNESGVAVVLDGSGNLFGTTESGGPQQRGSLFEIPKSTGVLTTLVEFDGSNGAHPSGPLIVDAKGDIFGTCNGEGGNNGNFGTVFELVKINVGYRIRTLMSFGGTDGAGPSSGVVMDSAGDLFGVTTGYGPYGYGTVFELINSGGNYTLVNLFRF
jgi:uncharacterized repeat protein (TIGR03803 family)